METAALSHGRKPAGNTATTWLKIIALVFMFIDHSGKMLFPAVQEMRILGRIAFPVYAWCMVVGLQASQVLILGDPTLEGYLVYSDDDGEMKEWVSPGFTLRN